jgi:hypothetical protein
MDQDQKLSKIKFTQLKLELSALITSDFNEQTESKFYQTQLKAVFDKTYSIEQVEAALRSLRVLNEKVEIAKLVNEYKESLIVFPDQHVEGI